MDWNTFLSSFLGAGAGTALIAVVFGAFLNNWLAKGRDQQKRQQELRDGSRAVAEILSEWVRSAYLGEFPNEDRWRLQSVYWKNILALDHKLLDLLLPRLANDPDAVGTNEIIVEARRLILNQATPDLAVDDLNNWPPVRQREA